MYVGYAGPELPGNHLHICKRHTSFVQQHEGATSVIKDCKGVATTWHH